MLIAVLMIASFSNPAMMLADIRRLQAPTAESEAHFERVAACDWASANVPAWKIQDDDDDAPRTFKLCDRSRDWCILQPLAFRAKPREMTSSAQRRDIWPGAYRQLRREQRRQRRAA